MDIAGNSYKNNASGVVVKVIDTFDNIAILENRSKMDVRELTNPELYTEELDVNSFINNHAAYNILADKIRNIPTELMGKDDDGGEVVRVNTGENSGMPTPQSNESLIINTNEDYEREELAKKYGVVDNREGINKQNAAFDKLLNPDSETPAPVKEVYYQPEEEQVQRFEVNREEQEEYKREYIQPVEDPIIKMFKGVKRNLDFNISIDIMNKIPRIDFIEMMEDSYESSIIDFLADEFTNNILNNPEMIRSMIKDKINLIVYGGKLKDVVKVEEPKRVRKIPSIPKSDLVVLDEGVPEKPKRTKRVTKDKKEEVK